MAITGISWEAAPGVVSEEVKIMRHQDELMLDFRVANTAKIMEQNYKHGRANKGVLWKCCLAFMVLINVVGQFSVHLLSSKAFHRRDMSSV